jgi:hypothetical protein
MYSSFSPLHLLGLEPTSLIASLMRFSPHLWKSLISGGFALEIPEKYQICFELPAC